MKTVTIPTCMNPYVVTINNCTYSFPAGVDVEVPDEVAAVIENHIKEQHTAQRASALSASEKAIIDLIGPDFFQDGNPVACTPAEGYPLEVVSRLGFNPNLITEDISGESPWPYDEDVCSPVYNIGDLPAGTYTIFVDADSEIGVQSFPAPDGMEYWEYICTVPLATPTTFYHSGGELRLCDNNFPQNIYFIKLEEGEDYTGFDAPDECSGLVLTQTAGNIEKTYAVYFGQTVHAQSFNWSTGVLTCQDGSTHKLGAQEIVGLPGVNTLSCDVGTIKVTSKAHPKAVIQDIHDNLNTVSATMTDKDL